MLFSLLAFAAGAARSLAQAFPVGSRVIRVMTRRLGADRWTRRGLGLAFLVGVVVIASGLDMEYRNPSTSAGTSEREQPLIHPDAPSAAAQADDAMILPREAGVIRMPAMAHKVADHVADQALAVEGQLPSLSGAVEWLNSAPLTAEGLRGKVVLVSFWTYSCINCLHSLPHVLAWAEKYKGQGLVVIGVHAPEFAAEKNLANVRKATRDQHIDYPVAVDNDFLIWRAFGNRYWPAHDFIDAQGRVRHHQCGEGEYDGSARVIQQLLAEAGRAKALQGGVKVVDAGGASATSIAGNLPDRPNRPSPESTGGRARVG